MTSVYERAGLMRNPFVADNPETLVAMDRGIALPDVDFVQVVGERGAGKTSLLRFWQQQHGGWYHYVAQGRSRWGPVPIRRPMVLWDEADRLPTVIVRRALQAAARGQIKVVVGTHRNLGGMAHSAGMTTAVIRLEGPDSDLLAAWIDRRVEASAHDVVRARQVLGEPPIAELVASGASWRAAGDHLHGWAAQRVISG